MAERLHLLRYGFERLPRWLSLEGGGDALHDLPVVGALVLAGGEWWLLETGLGVAVRERPEAYRSIYRWGDPVVLGSGDPVLDGLAACGVGVEDLAGVGVSHLHVDHSGGLSHAAERGLPVVVQRAELEFAFGAATVEDAYWREDFDDPRLRWEVLDGAAALADGLAVVPTPGHTPGHMSYVVDLPETGRWILAVDAIDLAEGVETGVPIGSSAREEDAPLRRASHELLVGMAARDGARLVPGHCPRTWAALAAPPAGYR